MRYSYNASECRLTAEFTKRIPNVRNLFLPLSWYAQEDRALKGLVAHSVYPRNPLEGGCFSGCVGRLHGSNPATQAFIAVNFRFARQPPTIVTWAELHFYDLPLIRPSGFVSSGRQGFSNQELGELRMDRRGYGNHRMLSRFCLSYRIDMLSRFKKARR
jgi:hypothetical protein